MIEVSDLSKRFGPVTAVDGLSFTVRPGRVTGFLGPNDAGKPTKGAGAFAALGQDVGVAGVGVAPGRVILQSPPRAWLSYQVRVQVS